MRYRLSASGPRIAGTETSTADWLFALRDRRPLVLSPDGPRGWFGGTSLLAFDPVSAGVIEGCRGDAIHQVGAVLQRAFDSEAPELAVASLPYSGDSSFAVYRAGLLLLADGWHAWGSTDPASLPTPGPRAPLARSPLVFDAHSDVSHADYLEGVEQVREAIAAGSVYVVNLTRREFASTDLSAPELFAALLASAPASMGAAWLGGASAVVSCSPERFVRVTGYEVEIAPVKGTRPRGRDAAEDKALVAELLDSEKERAEHVMIVDMERNDLGRVCESGSVRVDPLFELETTAYCHQTVSSVRGLLQHEAVMGDVLEATFPCGSITGAPKIAAMHVIDRLEHTPRSLYTGSLVVAIPGAMDSSVLIRTAELAGAHVTYGTGCGITIDSDPQEEWDESVLKTRPLFGGAPSVALRETCRIAGGSVPLWPYHRARLAAGGTGEVLLSEADKAVAEAAHAWADAPTRRGRLTVDVLPTGALSVEVDRRLSSLDVPNGPVAARVDVEEPPHLPSGPAKPADRTYWDAAHHIADATGGHQAVIVGPDGMVIDGSTATLWIAENGVLVTPHAPPAIPGVGRAFVLESAHGAGLVVSVEAISWERFEAADEAFFTNAFGGVAPVRGRGGEGFSAVKALFDELWGLRVGKR